MTKAEKLIAALESAGYTCRRYSGRAMYGKECVGVTIATPADSADVGAAMAKAGLEAAVYGKPRLDSMGQAFILYWPEAAL